uniref:G-protein coupled receptors family 1 profile domain-containing protein n=1 Tax=Trichobilharzia regenti TaxID=157069 RepID=A0AA85IZ07_TRIRE|nr:unnamed protein product [Trichobilharzia regenti]
MDELNHILIDYPAPFFFTEGEVTFLVIIFVTVIILAVLGNTVVCILLRFRYCTTFKCLRTLLGRNKSSTFIRSFNSNNINYNNNNNINIVHNDNHNNIDPWVEECPSSQHECSCGKTCIVQNTPRYVVFKSTQKSEQPQHHHHHQHQQLPHQHQQPPITRNYAGSLTVTTHFPTFPTADKRGSLVSNYGKLQANYTSSSTSSKSGMRSTSITSLFLFNLSLADILMAVLCIPVYVFTEIIYLSWPLGEPLCKIVPYAQGVSVFVSALTHVLISWDRFILVFFPLRPRMTHRKAVCLLFGVWILALIIPLPVPIVNRIMERENKTFCQEDWSLLLATIQQTTGNNFTDYEPNKNEISIKLFQQVITIKVDVVYTILLMILQYFLPLGVICGTYTAIALRVNRLKTPGERDSARDQKLTRAKRKALG